MQNLGSHKFKDNQEAGTVGTCVNTGFELPSIGNRKAHPRI
jgi:hypothetical protein